MNHSFHKEEGIDEKLHGLAVKLLGLLPDAYIMFELAVSNLGVHGAQF